MVTCYAALRFAEDANLSDRTYWYASAFALAAGERVIAPVGVHDRLQRAVVERVIVRGEPPYDGRMLTEVAARDGARRFRAGGGSFLELGGVRYDDRHYTRFGRVVLGHGVPQDALASLRAYGVDMICRTEEDGAAEILRALSCEPNCALVAGAGAGTIGASLLMAAGVSAEQIARDRALAADMGAAKALLHPAAGASDALTAGELSRLAEKLR